MGSQEAKSMYILAFNHDDGLLTFRVELTPDENDALGKHLMYLYGVCRYSLIPEKLYEIQTFQTIGQAHFEQTCVAQGLRAKERV